MFEPSCTGTVVFAASGIRLTKPESTRPMNAMKQPIPAAIAALSSSGDGVEDRGAEPGDGEQHDDDASITTRPIASGHVTCGAIDTASRLLMPRPVAMAKG